MERLCVLTRINARLSSNVRFRGCYEVFSVYVSGVSTVRGFLIIFCVCGTGSGSSQFVCVCV